jgi:hypothetical protein
MNRSFIWMVVILLITTACGPKADPNAQIRTAVEQTVAAIPTFTPFPAPPAPPTSAGLGGIFCEYQFCIGHPVEMAFFDVSAQRNPASPSTGSQGILAAYNANLFIQVMWQSAPGISDPQFMLDLILNDQVDTRSGSVEPLLVGPLNVFYAPITTTATAVLPYGGAAAWLCSGRAFAWKTYTPQPDLARSLLEEATGKFRCDK